MTLAAAIAHYVALNQSMGMRFQVDAGILRAFQRHAGEVDFSAISPEVIVAFLQPRQRVTSTWLMKHRALRRFYQHGITRGLVARSPVPTAVPGPAEAVDWPQLAQNRRPRMRKLNTEDPPLETWDSIACLVLLC